MVHQNGITLSDSELKRLLESADRQQDLVYEYIKRTNGKTTNELYDDLQELGVLRANTPESSIKRALTDLANSPDYPVYKSEDKRAGRYGVDVHVYKVKPLEGQMDAFGKPQNRNGIGL